MCSGAGKEGEADIDAHIKRKETNGEKKSSSGPRDKQEWALKNTVIKDESSTAGCQKALFQMYFLMS